MAPEDQNKGPFEYSNAVARPERQLCCRSYDACLDEAVRQRWRSWCCVGCGSFVEIDAERKRAEMFSLLELQVEVKNPSRRRKCEDSE